jgi:hypothetical protein
MKLSTYIFLLAIVFCTCNTKPDDNTIQVNADDTTKLSDLRFLQRIAIFKGVPVDTLLVAKYSFINIGQNDLFINDISPDCTCTGYYLSKKMVSPGDSAYILLKYSTKDKFGESKVYATVSANTLTRLYSLEIAATIKER